MNMPPQSKKYMAGYEPMYSGGRRPTWKLPTPKLSSFPADRTVVIRRDRHEDYVSILASIEPWLKDMNMRAKEITRAETDDGHMVDIVVMPSAKKAMIFKMRWG